MRTPTQAGFRGATTALIWVRREDKVEDSLVYGTQAGYLVGWKERLSTETQVKDFVQ